MSKIIIVEDDESLAELYRISFTKENYEVILASDGEEGLGKVLTDMPDIVLLDVMMPKMNGLEVLAKLKDNPSTSKLPVIMISNINDPSVENVAMQKGANLYLVKSQFVPKEIVAKVKELLISLPSQ